MDTTPFVNIYFDDPKDHSYDWRGIHPREAYLANLMKVNSTIDVLKVPFKFLECYSCFEEYKFEHFCH